MAARWMLAYGALLRSEPVEAYRLAREAMRSGGSALRPRYVYALRALQGAAMFDCGLRRRGLQEMQQARADLGEVHLSDEQASALAVLEHRAAVTLGHAHAALLDGTVTPVLPHTIVEALMLEVSASVSAGAVPAARRALRDALSSGTPLGIVRPFAMAVGQARELLAEQLSRAGATGPFVIRAMDVVHRPGTRAARLDDVERELLVRLPSALSIDQIARELRIPATEASTRVHAMYRKLGVRSRRTAVSIAHEDGLLR